ncbi:hypothetical protein J8273_4520 [Carpediemonas membranifera]|uniref:Uncharacterized protein n=1 Tax=Carpediemonas membranifera TaxID=201153 RepID=A0A8J6AW20_9EUKA|nr:hypothetical protein J8273_4520 [Carpediemonas membranifera]|eukprot:KAG9393920.1 hypothetical protein J8273_4520 [Carpediemonas membranifera]
MGAADSSHMDTKAKLITAYRISTTATAMLSGDVPSLISHAYTRHFRTNIPSSNDIVLDPPSHEDETLEGVRSILSQVPPLTKKAQTLLDRARSILTSGPPLSMNVELADGEDLPPCLFTLNQGAVWACLVGGGANPDLEDRVLEEARAKQPHGSEMHDKIRNALTPEGKCLWFLCRKFFFTMNVAEKDGECYHYSPRVRCYHHRMYMGRLFMLNPQRYTDFTRARMPKGMWGWGLDQLGQLGVDSDDFVDPTRLTFDACLKVAKLESSLPAWGKHRMVTGLALTGLGTIILTPVGTVMAGEGAEWFLGPGEHSGRFHPVPLPDGFVPDHMMHDFSVFILCMGSRQMVTGYNVCGKLGLGHESDMAGFVVLPFRVEHIIISGTDYPYTNFLCGRQLLFAGCVLDHIAQAGLLPGFHKDDICPMATPLRFPERVKGWRLDDDSLAWVTEGWTRYCSGRDVRFNVPFEATAVYNNYFRHSSGQWSECRAWWMVLLR